MIIEYNKKQLESILKDISILTGISISVLDTEYNLIATSSGHQRYCTLLQTSKKGKKACDLCDKKVLKRCGLTKKLERHICDSGLYDSAMPIVKQDTTVGYVIMGQVRSDESPSELRRIPYVDLGMQEELKRLYAETTFISKNSLDALYDLLPRILFNNAINITYDSFINEAVDFIDENLTQKLTVNRLCERLYVSKNRLYEAFRSNFNNTVVGYINERRIIRAKELLRDTDDSVVKIAANVGVDNYAYFCRMFKKMTGANPTQYRNKIRKTE